MKKLKKVFLICLFSFLFIVNVDASTTTIDFSEYSAVFENFLKSNSSWNKESIQNECDYLLKNYMSSNYNYYICSFRLREMTSSGVYTYNGKKYTPQFVISQLANDSILQYYYHPAVNMFYISNTDIFAKSREFTLNLSFSITNSGTLKDGLIDSYDWFNSNKISGGWITWSGIVKSNLSNQYFVYNNNSSYKTNNFNINGVNLGPQYNGGKILFSQFTPTSYSIFSEPLLNDKGTYNNSNVITYKINDEKVGNNKELKIKFTFLNELDVNANDISIYKYGSQVLTEYLGTTCVNENNDSVCEFNLKYNVYSSNTDKLMFDFRFNNSYNVKVEDTLVGNDVYSNYKNVEFEYKLLDFSKISGAIFYLRNYDNFDYMSEFLNPFEYAFGIWPCKDYGSFKGAITYGNDIEYKNNYIYKDIDNYYKFDNGTYIKINNLGMDNYLFEFDSNLLNENKYSSFVIRNRNYLGSLDNDNLPLYVYYNSSLFNYNKLDFSTNVNNGSTSNYFGTNQDFNFIVNGSQNSFDVGVSSGEIFEFDEEIKVQYKSGLQYFKDKIIDMFEFVSEFYNTMPEKFRVAFSLIFVLLIGIALFRLLL